MIRGKWWHEQKDAFLAGFAGFAVTSVIQVVLILLH